MRSLCVSRVGGRFLVHFIATSWSSLQACKIFSIAEIPKLDRVWQLLHRLLVTRERMHQMNPAVSFSCLQCNNGIEDLAHALIHCSYNQDVGLKLLNCIQNLVPDMKDQGLLHLDITGLSTNMEFPVVFLTSSILMYIWNQRMSKVRISLFDIRTSLEAKCILLRKTRFENHATGLETLLNSM